MKMNSSGGMNSTRQKVNQNIQVYVRVRPLNSRERGIRSCDIIDIVSHKDIIARHSPESKMTKKFSFDRTFGPNSKQSEVYLTVVSPLIEEVLAGYNCTVFAYGQTGTGKTHTMVGTECPEVKSSWEDVSDIGIIPRALSHLFDELRLMNLEFSMRISYLELYNEELCDLLSMDDSTKIRIFDDSTKKGSVIIQGLEEITVQCIDDVYKLLEKGKERRKTATTLMNAQSSRSHTVFSILVHIKENGIDGEEMLKIGKLNLVDLAGSENVSKAGNEKGIRVRETVNINQSLLTLGRVITALVERTPHIPYRESKLTRLLQESLGGRTKTSIIATISPGHKDIEETLSTLEYAHRAKNIQNKPEVNQKLTKKTVLKEYTEEIDRLKRDLMAARDRNGIYLAEETYNDIQFKLESQNKELNEKMLLVRALKEELTNKEKIFNEVSLHLVEKTEVLKKTEEHLDVTKSKLSETKKILSSTKRRYKEKKVVLDNHIKTEEELTKHATHLIEVADVATRDTQQLHNTIERRKDVEIKIKTACEQFFGNISHLFGRMDGDLELLQNEHASTSQMVFNEIKDSATGLNKFTASAVENIKTITKTHENSLIEFDECFKKCTILLKDTSDDHTNLFATLCSKIKQNNEDIKVKVDNRLTELKNMIIQQNTIIHNTYETIQKQQSSDQITMNEYYNKTCSNLTLLSDKSKVDFEHILNLLQSQVKNRKTISERRKRAVDEFLAKMVQVDEEELSEMGKSEQIEDQILKTKSNIENSITDKVQNMNNFLAQKDIDFKNVSSSLNTYKSLVTNTFDKCDTEIDVTCDEIEKFTKENSEDITVIQDSVLLYNENVETILTNWSQDVNKTKEVTTRKLENQCQEAISFVQTEEKRSNAFNIETKSLTSYLESHVNNYGNTYKNNMDNCIHQLNNFYRSELKTYTPSGQTPSKREFMYSKKLATTSPHNTIIKRLRQEYGWSDLENTTITEDNIDESLAELLNDEVPKINSTPIKITITNEDFNIDSENNSRSMNIDKATSPKNLRL